MPRDGKTGLEPASLFGRAFQRSTTGWRYRLGREFTSSSDPKLLLALPRNKHANTGKSECAPAAEERGMLIAVER